MVGEYFNSRMMTIAVEYYEALRERDYQRAHDIAKQGHNLATTLAAALRAAGEDGTGYHKCAMEYNGYMRTLEETHGIAL